MQFCPKCENLLVPNEKQQFICSCGYKRKIEGKITLKEEVNKSKIGKGVAVDQQEAMGTVSAECPKCKNNRAIWWSEQTRATDEPETQFFRCTKCKHTWREYD